jgi:hypothetical protein
MHLIIKLGGQNIPANPDLCHRFYLGCWQKVYVKRSVFKNIALQVFNLQVKRSLNCDPGDRIRINL